MYIIYWHVHTWVFRFHGIFLSQIIRLVPESIRWLAVKGRLDEAEAVVERVASLNGHTKPSNTRQRLQKVADEEEKAGRGHHYTYLDVYRGRRMVFTTLILNFIWFV